MDEAHQLAAKWGIPVAIAFMAVAVRILISADRWTVIGIVRGLAVGTLVGWLAILWVWEIPSLSLGMRGCIIGLCATLAEDVFMGLLTIGKKFRDDPIGTFQIIRNLGRKQQ